MRYSCIRKLYLEWLAALSCVLLMPFFALAQVTVFQADFQNSTIEVSTDEANLEAGTLVGSWSFQIAQNVNVYGNAGRTEKALCPDSNGGDGSGYALTAYFSSAVLLQSNVVVTFKLARGRTGAPGTGKRFNVTGYDSLGNPSFALQVFANQDQAAGTNGALYWNNNSYYTNWFGTNYSVAGDVRQFNISSLLTNSYQPGGMTAIRLDLKAAGYTVSLDKNDDGTFDWISALLPYDSDATTISRISFTGGSGAGNWFDDISVTGVLGNSPVKTINNSYVFIQPEDQTQLINGWGFDIKGTSGNVVTPSYADTLFVTDKMNVLRVPIWGNDNQPAHPAAGVVIGSYYTDQLYAMTNARAANSNVIFFASKKLDGTNSFPSWTKDSTGVIVSQYSVMLADYLQYIYTNGGFSVGVLGIDNERQYNEGNITPSVYNDIINNLRTLAANRGIPLPKYFIAPENYNPDKNWFATLIDNGWDTNVDIVGTHYYPGNRPLSGLQALVALGGARPDWHSEVHWDDAIGDVMDDAEATLATFFDCTDSGLSEYVWWAYTRSNIKGDIEQALSVSTADTRPATTTDSDGHAATLGKLIARAYRGPTNLVIWVLNNNTNFYVNCKFNINRGTYTGPASYTQWGVIGSSTDSASLLSNTNFAININARTVTRIDVGYQPPGPDAYYPLDGNVVDSSGNGNNGTASSRATNYITGRIGALAMQFDGSTNCYVQIPRSIGNATNFSIAFWMKTTATGGPGVQWWNGAGLVDGEVNGTTNDFGVSLISGNIAFGIGNPDTTLFSTGFVNDGRWHHVAVTRNEFTGEMSLYLDGTLDANSVGPAGPQTASPVLRLGGLQTGVAAKYYIGALDDVRLYNGLLGGDAIEQLAATPEENHAPVLATIPDQTFVAGQTLNLTNSVTDPDVPPQVLTWSLQPVISNLTINAASGVVSWRPAIVQSPTNVAMSVIVSDNGSPSLSTTQEFLINVLRPIAPILSSDPAADNDCGLTIQGSVGPDYLLQSSTNLQIWTTILLTNPVVLPFTVPLSSSNNLPEQFYRVKLGP